MDVGLSGCRGEWMNVVSCLICFRFAVCCLTCLIPVTGSNMSSTLRGKYIGAAPFSFCRVALKRGKGEMKSPGRKML